MTQHRDTRIELTAATRNPHKTREIQEILGSDFLVSDLSDRPDVPEVAETGSTFEQNAILKALGVSHHVTGLVLADDSGLEVDVLGGAPGILSARYAGQPSNDRQNIEKLLRALDGVDPKKQRRQAKFRCVLAAAKNGELLKTFSGQIEGLIVDQPRGAGGFGYDPVFVPRGFTQTFAELPPETKNRLSHRGRAAATARPFLKTLQ